MFSINVQQQQHMLFLSLALCMLSAIYGPSTVLATSTGASTWNTPAGNTADVHQNQAHKNMASYANYLVMQRQQQQQRQQRQLNFHFDNANDDAVDSIARDRHASTRRSYGSSNDDTTSNGLNSLTNLQHISIGYAAATPTASAAETTTYKKQQIPIYEEQKENDYVAGITDSSAYHDGSSSSSSWSNTIYNLRAAAAQRSGNNYNHNSYAPTLSYPSHTVASAVVAGPTQSSDKISDGNFLHHYEHNSVYGEAASAASSAADEQQLQYFAQHANSSPSLSLPSSSSSSSSSSSYPADVAASAAFAQQHSSSTDYIDDVHGDYPTTGSAASPYGALFSPNNHDSSDHQPNVINYIPYPVVKKQHVPVHEPVQIPISHTVIVPIRKPVPIHIPVTQQVQVPVEKELKIPVERVVPFPVEKHVPVPVEKRVPYPVVKYVPVKIARPFPVKVPVFKTVLHKVKGWW